MSSASTARRISSAGKRRAANSSGESPGEGAAKRPDVATLQRTSLRSASRRAARKKEVRRLRDAETVLEEAPVNVVGERAQGALEAMLRALAIRRGASAPTKKMQPLWRHVKSLVVTANREGLRRAYAAFPSEEGHYFFSKALATLEYSASTSTAADGGEFAECPLLLGYLTEVTLNNIAFQQYTACEPPEVVLKTMQRALKAQSHQAFRTLTLYNTAVVHLAARRYEEATEFVARCNQVADVCLELEVPLTREISSLYRDYHTMVATHAIMCHHLLAGLAAWSDEHAVEVYHAQLALCCAKKFLTEESALMLRCRQRLVAAESGTSAAVIARGEDPPRMQMMTDDLEILANPLFLQFLLETQRMQRVVFPPLKGAQKGKATTKRGSRVGSAKLSSGTRSISSAAPATDSRQATTPEKRTRMPTLPAVIQELRREGSVEPPMYEVYAPPSPTPPLVVTCVPQTAYECYKGLRKDMRELMCSLGRLHQLNAADETTEPSPVDSERIRSLWKVTSSTSESGPAPGRYLRITDKRLRMLSALVRDLRFENLLRAVILAQSHWRGIVSRRDNGHRQPLVRKRMREREACEVIQHAYRNYLATREAIEEKYALRAHRTLVQRLTVVQQHLRGWQSVIEERNRGLITIARLKEAILEAKRQVAASIRIQSVWRMCSVRVYIGKLLAATIELQRVWRGHVGRVAVREERVRERLRKQDRLAVLVRHVYPLQKWWRGVLAVKQARDLVKQMREKVALYLKEQERAVDALWGRFTTVENVEQAVLKILAVLQAYRSREACARKYSLMLRRRRFLLSIVWKKRAVRQVEMMRKEKLERRRLQRRREEVADAVLMIQCAVRRWFAVKKREVLRQFLSRYHECARKIQTMYRQRVGHRAFLEAKMNAKLEEEKRMISQLRHYSASKIQATWRMFQAWSENRDYLRFLHHDRHMYATRIKNAWVRYRGRQNIKIVMGMRLMEHQQKQSNQVLLFSVVRIQAVSRMFLVRSQMMRDGLKLPPTLAKLHRSARSIQSLWRRYAAYEYVQQLRFSRAYYDQQKVNMESLHTYATMIQSLLRAKLFNPRLVAMRQREIERATEEEKMERITKITKVYALFTKENMCLNRKSPLPLQGSVAPFSSGGAALESASLEVSFETADKHRLSGDPHSFSVKLGNTRVLSTQSMSHSFLSCASQSADIGASKDDEGLPLVARAAQLIHNKTRSSSSDQLEVIKSQTATAFISPPCAIGTRSTTIVNSFSVTFSGCTEQAIVADGFSESEERVDVDTPHPSGVAENEVGSVTASDSSHAVCYDPAVLAVVVPLIQRCGRGLISRASTWRRCRKSDRWLAAIEIQRMWRGFSARQLVEVYYEFYMEEVEVAASE